MTVGTNGVGSTDWFPWSREIAPFQIGFAIESTGATANLEHTYDDPNSQQAYSVQPNSNFPPVVFQDPTLSAVTSNTQGSNGTNVYFASRLTITAGTTAVILQAIQAGITN